MRIRLVDLASDRDPVLEFLGRENRTLSESKHAYLVRGDGRPGVGIMAETREGIAGYVGLAPAREDEWAMEMISDPAAAEALVEASLSAAREHHGRRLRWWVYEPGLEGLAVSHGFRPERELLMMGRAIPSQPSPEPTEFTLSAFRPGVDEERWLEVNNAAFTGHPETGDMTLLDLGRRQQMDWFDPEGVRMAWEGKRLAGFCWTKVHSPEEGEIYIIGVHPDYQGRGLGPALVREGMRHLASVGCDRVFLYTEGDNQVAVGMYRRLGFEVERVHRSFLRDLEV